MKRTNRNENESTGWNWSTILAIGGGLALAGGIYFYSKYLDKNNYFPYPKDLLKSNEEEKEDEVVNEVRSDEEFYNDLINFLNEDNLFGKEDLFMDIDKVSELDTYTILGIKDNSVDMYVYYRSYKNYDSNYIYNLIKEVVDESLEDLGLKSKVNRITKEFTFVPGKKGYTSVKSMKDKVVDHGVLVRLFDPTPELVYKILVQFHPNGGEYEDLDFMPIVPTIGYIDTETSN